MSEHFKLKNVKAAAQGASIAAVLVAILTISGELWHPLKDFLKEVFTHHWLGKSALALGVFVLVYQLKKNSSARSGSTSVAIWTAVVSSVLASLAMLAFFVLHTFHIFI